jgi:protoporphyrin/coproporphyrin ferrochelatase
VPNDAVLLVAHGTVTDLDDLPEFLLRIRHGRPASAELVAELRRRYEAIGGSPLLDVTRAQAEALETELGLPVTVGMRLWSPTLEDAIRQARERGAQRLCVVPLAPYSVHVYAEAADRARAALGSGAPELVHVEAWGSAPELVAAHARAIASVLEQGSADAALVLTAHSLPERAISAGDPYADQVKASAEAIGAALGRAFRLAYQSQGADGGQWLGPDLGSTLEELARAGTREVVVAPFGFLADHVETLYDLDVEARARARALGLELRRVPALNRDPGFIAALAAVARRALGPRAT